MRTHPATDERPSWMVRRHDRLMFADDMFLEGVQQVFSVRTGDFIGYSGQQHEHPEPPPEPEPKNENQLQLEL